MTTRVIFFQVKEAKAKLSCLLEMATAHFAKKEPLLIFVEDEKTALYVDDLLWKLPPTSFLPHAIVTEGSTELVAITHGKANLTQAKIAFNLCSTPLLVEGPFRILYDFEDLTSPSKKQLSELRFDAYKRARLPIEAR